MTKPNYRHESQALEHFLGLVSRGACEGSSSGAQSALHIAAVLSAHVPALDQMALDGMKHFATICKFRPETGRAMIEGRCDLVDDPPGPAEWRLPR